jgi:hypothetical protein
MKKDKTCHYMLQPQVSSWISDLIICESEYKILLVPWSVWQTMPMKKIRLVVTVLLCTGFFVFLPTWFVVWVTTDFYSARSNRIKFVGWDGTAVPSQTCHRSAAMSVYCTKSCIYSQKVLLRMGEFVARNM